MPHHAFKTGHAHTHYHDHELHFHLYMHHYPNGSHPNATTAVHSNHHHRFGAISVVDWPIYDGPGPHAKTVAHGQGLFVHGSLEGTGGCHNSFTIKFGEHSGFKGSTLHVMGDAVTSHDSAIVGGTGTFTLARGVIHKSRKETNSKGYIVELDMHAIYTPMRKAHPSNENIWRL